MGRTSKKPLFSRLSREEDRTVFLEQVKVNQEINTLMRSRAE